MLDHHVKYIKPGLLVDEINRTQAKAGAGLEINYFWRRS